MRVSTVRCIQYTSVEVQSKYLNMPAVLSQVPAPGPRCRFLRCPSFYFCLTRKQNTRYCYWAVHVSKLTNEFANLNDLIGNPLKSLNSVHVWFCMEDHSFNRTITSSSSLMSCKILRPYILITQRSAALAHRHGWILALQVWGHILNILKRPILKGRQIARDTLRDNGLLAIKLLSSTH